MNSVEISFLGVQPLQINYDVYSKILTSKTSFSNVNKYINTKNEKISNLEWFKNYNNLYESYHMLREISLPEIEISLLKKDLQNQLFYAENANQDILELSPYLNNDKTKYSLFYDLRFSYFIIVYEIYFIFEKHILENFLNYQNYQEKTKKKDFYNTIRNLIVYENDQSKIGTWGKNIQQHSIKKAELFLKKIYKLKEKNYINIPHNSCNISCFIIDLHHENDLLANKFDMLNNYAERVSTFTKIKKFYNNNIYFAFHGRFHTIYIKRKDHIYRYQPLQFHIQYMWFLLEQYNNFMNKINLELMQNDSMKNLYKYAKIIHFMINKIELLYLHDNNFKHSIEIDYQMIYKENEKRWALPELLYSTQRYVQFFKDYLDRLFSQKNNLSQKKQNNILLLISILQLVALISVWNDYLSLLNKDNIQKSKKILDLFESLDSLLEFNFFTPVYIFSIIAIILLYLIIKKK